MQAFSSASPRPAGALSTDKHPLPKPPFAHGPGPHFVDCNGYAPPFVPSHDLLRLMAAVPQSATAAFTSAHLAALDVALAQTRQHPANHRIDFRASLPFFRKRYYVVLLAGKERRSLARIRRDGQDDTWRLSLAYGLLMTVVASCTMFCVVVVLYLVKSMLGIDIFPEHSWLHGLFF